MSIAETTDFSLPGHPHNRDLANPGEWGFILVGLLWIAAHATAFTFLGLAGIGLVMVASVPLIFVALLLITVGK